MLVTGKNFIVTNMNTEHSNISNNNRHRETNSTPKGKNRRVQGKFGLMSLERSNIEGKPLHYVHHHDC